MSLTNTDHAGPDKIYYDVVVTNFENNTAIPPAVYFNETRNNPFLLNPEAYFASIIRFTLDTPSLPILTCLIQPGQTQSNPNLSAYSTTLTWSYLGVNYTSGQTFLIYAPQDLTASIPKPPSMNVNYTQDNENGYYYIYNYQYFIYLVNLTFNQAYLNLYNNILAVSPAAAAAFVATSPYAPSMTYNTTDYIAILNTDLNGYNTSTPGSISIFFNGPMTQLFTSFPTFVYSITGSITGFSPYTYNGVPGVTTSTGMNVKLETTLFGGSNTQPNYLFTNPVLNTTGEATAINTYQEYSSVSLWTPVTAIVFCSNTLPIIPNQVSAPLIFQNGVPYTSGNNANIANIISDFVSDNGIYKPSIVYSPTAQYRYISMIGNRPIYNLDVSVYWRSREGVLQPFRLTSGSTATIKILFTAKDSQAN
jgi:hypothetical protein